MAIAEKIEEIATSISNMKRNLNVIETAPLFKLERATKYAVIPMGTIDITENGEIDVSDYATANVNIQGSGDIGEYFDESLIQNTEGSTSNSITGLIWYRALKKFPPFKIKPSTTSLQYAFYNFPTDIEFTSDTDTSNVTNMSYMFNGARCQSIDLTKINTSNVTSMNNMFYTCSKVKELNVSNFNTSKVTNMAYMFNTTTELTKLIGLSNLDTSKVTNMNSMFASFGKQNGGLEIDISNFDTSSITTISQMFSYSKLKKIVAKGFCKSNITQLTSMFSSCNYLKEVDFSDWDTTGITSFDSLFGSTSSATYTKVINLDLSSFETPNLTNISSMFRYAKDIAIIDMSKFDFSKVTTITYAFQNCGTASTIANGAYAAGIPYVYVKDKAAQDFILGLTGNNRPATWTTDNVIIAGSEQDLRGVE